MEKYCPNNIGNGSYARLEGGTWCISTLENAGEKNFTAHKKALRATGGGPQESELSPLDDMLREIVPQDFEEDENMFDSDAMVKLYHKLFVAMSKLQNTLSL